MATYYVDGKNGDDRAGNGNSNNPWKTITKGVAAAGAGDIIKVRTAVYREVVVMSKDNVTLMADEGHQPVMDGGYSENLFNNGQLPAPDDYLPGHRFRGFVHLAADGTTVDGLTFQNAAGRGVVSSGSRTTIRNCRIDFCYASGIVHNSDGVKAGLLIENNTVTRCSMKEYHRDRTDAPADGAITVVRSENGIVRHNIVAYSHGEGINCGQYSINLLVEGNVVHTCSHVALYIMRSQNTVLRNNFVYHLYLKAFMGNNGQQVHPGIGIGDERGRGTPRPHSAGSIIYNNIVVGMGINFVVRNNNTNYNTALEDTYIGYNTFVSSKYTRVSVQIEGNKAGRRFRRSLFENNIILANHGVVGRAVGDTSGLTFRNNLWSNAPAGELRGPGDKVGDPRLANPDATIDGTAPGPTNADPFNYQLTKNSSLAIGTASNGSATDGFRPPQVNRDFFNANRDDKPDLGAHEFGGVTARISANFSIGPGQQTGAAPHTVDFTDRSSSDATIVRWIWEFGDGSTSTERNPSHTYMRAGTFSVTLSIEDQTGQKDTMVQPDLITALPEDVNVTPENFRRFLLVEDATDDVLAYGVQYPDDRCILLWTEEPIHVLNYADIDDVSRTHEVAGTRSLVWIDPALEPVETIEIFDIEDEFVV